MRILQISSAISINSGVMSVLMNYYRHIRDNELSFDFLYYSEPKAYQHTYIDEIKKLGGKVYKVSSPKNLARFKRELSEIIDENLYEIVQIHDTFLARFIYKLLKEHGVKCVIVYSHATKWSDKYFSGVRNRILCSNITGYCDRCFACSRAAGVFLYKSSDFTVVNNAIDTRRYSFNDGERSRLRKYYNVSDKLVIGHVGNFNYQKNHDYLIKIFHEINKLNNNTVLMLVGDGKLKKDIKNSVEGLNLSESVIFVGTVDNTESYYSAMDVFVLPSLYEGLPMAGVEAQCSGLKCFFSDTITQEIDLNNAKFMSINDEPKKWAIAISATAPYTLEERKLADQVVAQKGFDIEIESVKLIEIYKSIVGGPTQ